MVCTPLDSGGLISAVTKSRSIIGTFFSCLARPATGVFWFELKENSSKMRLYCNSERTSWGNAKVSNCYFCKNEEKTQQEKKSNFNAFIFLMHNTKLTCSLFKKKKEKKLKKVWCPISRTERDKNLKNPIFFLIWV